MPIPVRVFGAVGQQMDLVLDNNTDNQIFDVAVPFSVTNVSFDPEKHIISKNNTTSLGTADMAIADAVKLYPNPTSNILNIEVPSFVSFESATVYNSVGQKVIVTSIQNIDVSMLSNGVYFINIETSAATVHRKFIKN
jgi:hypothetical protein